MKTAVTTCAVVVALCQFSFASGEESSVRLVQGWSGNLQLYQDTECWLVGGEGNPVAYKTATNGYDSAELVFIGDKESFPNCSVYNWGTQAESDWIVSGIDLTSGSSFKWGGHGCFAIGSGGITGGDGNLIRFTGTYGNILRRRIRLRASQSWNTTGDTVGLIVHLGVSENSYGYIVADPAATEWKLLTRTQVMLFTEFNDLASTTVTVADKSLLTLAADYPSVATPVGAAKLNAAKLVISGPEARIDFLSDRSGESAADILAPRLALEGGAKFEQNGMILDFEEIAVTGSGASTLEVSGEFAENAVPVDIASGASLITTGVGTFRYSTSGVRLSGAGDFTVSGGEMRIASVDEDYSGTITVSGGTLYLPSSTVLGQRVIQTSGDGRVFFEVSSEGDSANVSDSSALVTDKRIVRDLWPFEGDTWAVAADTTLIVSGEGLAAGKTVELQGGTMSVTASCTIGADIVQGVTSQIVLGDGVDVVLGGEVSVSTSTEGTANVFQIGGSATASCTFAGGAVFDTVTDELKVTAGDMFFRDGSYVFHGAVTWQDNAGNVVFGNGAVVRFEAPAGVSEDPRLVWYRPAANGLAFEVADGAQVTVGALRTLYMGWHTSGVTVGDLTLRVSGGKLEVLADSKAKITFDPNRNSYSDPYRSRMVLEISGGEFVSGRVITRVSQRDSTGDPQLARIICSGGVWKAMPQVSSSSIQDLISKSNTKPGFQNYFPCSITGDFTLDISEMTGKTVNYGFHGIDSIDGVISGGEGASLTVKGASKFVINAGFEVNGMSFKLEDGAKVEVMPDYMVGTQNFNEISLAAGTTYTVPATVSFVTLAEGTDLVASLLAPRVCRRVDTAFYDCLLRLDAAAALTYDSLLPDGNGVVIVDNFPSGTGALGYRLPVTFSAASDESDNLATWTVVLGGRTRKVRPVIVDDGNGGFSMELQPASGFTLKVR